MRFSRCHWGLWQADENTRAVTGFWRLGPRQIWVRGRHLVTNKAVIVVNTKLSIARSEEPAEAGPLFSPLSSG